MFFSLSDLKAGAGVFVFYIISRPRRAVYMTVYTAKSMVSQIPEMEPHQENLWQSHSLPGRSGITRCAPVAVRSVRPF